MLERSLASLSEACEAVPCAEVGRPVGGSEGVP